VLLVFSYLIVPALAGILLASRIGPRLAVGWIFGAGVSILAMVASAVLDLPTGATVVCAFGLSLLVLGLLLRLRPRPMGAAALADPGGGRA
jgi:zinc/manganese transport system permease protein